MKARIPHATQRGFSLVVALIFLAILSILAVAVFHSVNNELRIVANAQSHQESLYAAQLTIEETIGATDFFKNPDGVANKSFEVDMNGDGVADYVAKVVPRPTCYRAKNIQASELPAAPRGGTAADPYAPCRAEQKQGSTFVESEAAVASASPESCANSDWDIGAQVTDAASQTRVAVHQGVSVVIFGNEVANYCGTE